MFYSTGSWGLYNNFLRKFQSKFGHYLFAAYPMSELWNDFIKELELERSRLQEERVNLIKNVLYDRPQLTI
jgi:hypothetical protein